jgi:hypothetical protein
MRINVYSQELTSEVKLIAKESDGIAITGIPCFPNGQPNGKPRCALDGFELGMWKQLGQPSDMPGLTNPVLDIRKEPVIYHAAQLMLHSSPMLHHREADDDRSAVTFWLPKSETRREEMARAFERIAEIFRTTPTSGSD